jgi:hypothetical protein
MLLMPDYFRALWNVPDPDPHHFDGDRDGIGCESGLSVDVRGTLTTRERGPVAGQ